MRKFNLSNAAKLEQQHSGQSFLGTAAVIIFSAVTGVGGSFAADYYEHNQQRRQLAKDRLARLRALSPEIKTKP